MLGGLLVDSHLSGAIVSSKAGVMELKFSIGEAGDNSQELQLIKSVFDTFDIYQLISDILWNHFRPLLTSEESEKLWKILDKLEARTGGALPEKGLYKGAVEILDNVRNAIRTQTAKPPEGYYG